MSNATTFVGLDVHARPVKACAFVPETGETIRKSFGYEPGEIASWVSSLPQSARCVYESGVTGFHLCRELNAMGAACVIGAVSKMHKPAADRGRKTDRRDAQFLAVQLALGVVTEVHVPDAECEGARDLARALADARDDAVRAKQRLSKFLLRHGLVYDERNAAGQRRNRWTGDFWAWVGRIDLGDAAAMATLDHYCERVREADAAKAALEAKVKSLAQQPRWKPTCDALKCLKGIDAVTAASIACEADGFARFATASGFAAWVGLVPSEHSSGESRFRGGITKAGNKHLRKLLVEAAWHYKGASRSPKDLAKGQVVDAATRRHANAGVRRLVDRRRSMDDAGKQSSVANVAVARELACWCWAVGRMAEGALRERRAHIRVFPGIPGLDGRRPPSSDFFRAAAKPPRTPKDRRDGGAGRSNEMHRRILRDGRILNCQTGVDPTRAVNGDCGGDRLGQGRTKSPLALHCLLTMSCSYYKRRPRGHLQAIFELLGWGRRRKKIGQNRSHDPAPQTRGFLTGSIIPGFSVLSLTQVSSVSYSE